MPKENITVKILDTERLYLREIKASDGEFVLNLLNQPSFIKYIGDRSVQTVGAAREYIESRFTESYRRCGFGMWAVESKETDVLMGICGFVKRDTLPDADIGFAFLPQYEKRGYAFESAKAVLKYGANSLNLRRVLAVTTQDNEASGGLLAKLDFTFERLIKMPPADEELKLFARDL